MSNSVESRDLLVLIRELAARVDGLDRFYETRIDAVESALAAHAQLNDATFAANDKAILKAEDAQRELNVKNNEFRQQLDDQAQLFLPRTEGASGFRSVEEKLISIKGELQAAIKAVSDSSQRDFDAHTRVLDSLSLTRSAGEGKAAGSAAMWGYVFGAIGLIALLLTLVVNILQLSGSP